MSEARPPSAKRRRIDVTESFKLIVGAEKREIVVHKEVLIKSSQFFKACCDGHDWKEKATKKVPLPDEEVACMSAYISWLYVGELVPFDNWLHTNIREKPIVERQEATQAEFDMLLNLAILGDKLCDAVFGNTVVDAYLTLNGLCNLYFNANDISELYERLPASHNLLKLIVDQGRAQSAASFERHIVQDLHHAYVTDLARALYQNQGEKKPRRPRFPDRCNYHTHGPNDPKCA